MAKKKQDKKIKKVEFDGWTIKAWVKGKKKILYIGDMPDDVSQPIDDFLTELENKLCPKCYEEMYEPDLDILEKNAIPYWYCPKCKKNIKPYVVEE